MRKLIAVWIVVCIFYMLGSFFYTISLFLEDREIERIEKENRIERSEFGHVLDRETRARNREYLDEVRKVR